MPANRIDPRERHEIAIATILDGLLAHDHP
jgi:hypothetical protein